MTVGFFSLQFYPPHSEQLRAMKHKEDDPDDGLIEFDSYYGESKTQKHFFTIPLTIFMAIGRLVHDNLFGDRTDLTMKVEEVLHNVVNMDDLIRSYLQAGKKVRDRFDPKHLDELESIDEESLEYAIKCISEECDTLLKAFSDGDYKELERG